MVRRLVVSLAFRFCRHGGTFESNHFLRQRRRMMMTTTPTSTSNQTTRVKRPREGGVCVILFFLWVLFCGRFFFSPLCFYQSQKTFITNNLIITFKLNIIEGFYHKVNDFVMSLVFLNFCHSFKKIAKKKKRKKSKKCCRCEHVNT